MADSQEEFIRGSIEESIRTKTDLANEEGIALIARATTLVRSALAKGNKVLFCGNGGSAADCQHLASELVGRFGRKGKGLPAIALSADTSVLTALANDTGYENVFSRQLQALGSAGDVLVAISTSGRSSNVLRAAEVARDLGLKVIGITGKDGDPLTRLSDVGIQIPSQNPSRIQESQLTVGHIICDFVEREIS